MPKTNKKTAAKKGGKKTPDRSWKEDFQKDMEARAPRSYREELDKKGLADEHDRNPPVAGPKPPKPAKRGARSKAREVEEAKNLQKYKKQKKERRAKREAAHAAVLRKDVPDEIAPKKKERKQTRIGEDGAPEEMPPPPDATWQERLVTQRLGASQHFKASVDGETFDALSSAGTFLQRVAAMQDCMKALPTVKVIPEGAFEKEAHALTREFERKFGLGERPYDFSAAAKSQRPPPKVVEQEVVIRPKAVSAEPKSIVACAPCKGSAELTIPCQDLKCGEPLYVHECTLGKKQQCPACDGKGKVACPACNGHSEVEATPPGATTTVAVACPKCRPADHEKDLAALSKPAEAQPADAAMPPGNATGSASGGPDA